MGSLDIFARELTALEDAPEPYRSALRQALPVAETARLLVFGPSYRSVGRFSPTTVLALTDCRWAVASEQPHGGCGVSSSDFANTLAVELTEILLYGRLRILFADNGRARWTVVEFNTVMSRLYERAAQLLLDAADNVAGAGRSESPLSGDESALLQSLPFKFKSAARRHRPGGQRLRAVLYQPAVVGRRLRFFQQELVPENLLALTDRHLMLVSEEKSRSWWQLNRHAKYGNLVTYCPLSRVVDFRAEQGEHSAMLQLRLGAPGGSGVVTFEFASESLEDVTGLVRRAISRSMLRESA